MKWGLMVLSAAALAATAASAGVISGTGQPGPSNLGLSNATRLASAPAGLGHMLLLPYFSAQEGNATLVSITNTDFSNGKAVKLSFRGASNGDSLLEMTVLLAPGDVWTATLLADAGGVGQIVTLDKTCTVPNLVPRAAQPFLTGRLNPQWSPADKANHTREGYLQVINMADIPNLSTYGASPADGQSALFKAIKPVNGELSCDAAALQAALLQVNHKTEATAAAAGLAAPTGGLGGKWSIINVPQTTTYSGAMHALRAVDANGADARANFVLFPPTDGVYPDEPAFVTADPLLRRVSYAGKTAAGVPTGATAAAAVQARYLDFPDLSTPYTPGVGAGGDSPLAQAARVTAALDANAIANEYTVETVIGAATDWVLSMPTRRYSVAVDYAGAPAPRKLYSTVPPAGNQYFHDSNMRTNPFNASQFCTEVITERFADRNSTFKTTGAIFLDRPPQTLMCGAVSVARFAVPPTGSALAGSVTLHDIGSRSFTTGWATLGLLDPATSLGLPVIGSSFMKAINPSAKPGVSGTYGLTAEHWRSTGSTP